MNRNLLYSIKGMFVAAAALVGVAACTDDDHFDVQVSGTAAESVWDNMRNAGQLNDFLSVLERTTVMRSENDQAATITYADLLKQPQYFTIWAPEDGTYDVSRYKALLDSADKAKQAGNMVAFRDFNNTVETQFVRNHISRSSFANATAPLRVQLMNNKRVVYDPAGQTFNEVALDNTFGFRSANNGMLYKLTGISPFAYNILESMSSCTAMIRCISMPVVVWKALSSMERWCTWTPLSSRFPRMHVIWAMPRPRTVRMWLSSRTTRLGKPLLRS